MLLVSLSTTEQDADNAVVEDPMAMIWDILGIPLNPTTDLMEPTSTSEDMTALSSTESPLKDAAAEERYEDEGLSWLMNEAMSMSLTDTLSTTLAPPSTMHSAPTNEFIAETGAIGGVGEDAVSDEPIISPADPIPTDDSKQSENSISATAGESTIKGTKDRKKCPELRKLKKIREKKKGKVAAVKNDDDKCEEPSGKGDIRLGESPANEQSGIGHSDTVASATGMPTIQPTTPWPSYEAQNIDAENGLGEQGSIPALDSQMAEPEQRDGVQVPSVGSDSSNDEESVLVEQHAVVGSSTAAGEQGSYSFSGKKLWAILGIAFAALALLVGMYAMKMRTTFEHHQGAFPSFDMNSSPPVSSVDFFDDDDSPLLPMVETYRTNNRTAQSYSPDMDV